jgi:hypothetical protein
MIGFEVELDRRVTDATGAKIPGDKNLAICDGEFKAVSDSRTAEAITDQDKSIAYSNIELVSEPFDQMLGTEAISRTWQDMSTFAESCYKISDATTLRDVLTSSGLAHRLTEEGATAVVHPAPDLIGPIKALTYQVEDGGLDNLFVHYTVGYPALSLGTALEWLTGKVRPEAEDPADDDGADFPIINANRATRAGQAAAGLFRRWSAYRVVECTEADATALAGYISLLYTQIAAVVDHSYAQEKTQIKNKTIVVCRVPLRKVAGVLPANVQQFLREQAWVDMLTDYEVTATAASLRSFINGRATEAKQTAKDKQASGTAAETALLDLSQRLADAERGLADIGTALTLLS